MLLVAPVPPSGNRSLTVAALRGPGVAPGLLRSATTRRSGFVTLADVAPTVLDQLGVAPPESMEGRRMLDDAGHGSAADRRALLEQANADGLLRDDLVNPVTATVLWIAIVLAVASALLLVVVPSFLLRRPWLARVLQWVALALIGFLLATTLATVLHFGERSSKVAYWTFGIAFAVVFVVLCRALAWHAADRRAALGARGAADGERRRPAHGRPSRVQLGVRVLGDSGDPLLRHRQPVVRRCSQLPRLLVACFAAWRWAHPWGIRIALAVLAVSFVAITPPLFGQDFGGTLAAAPAFALLAWLLLGRRLTVKAVLGLVAILLASGLVVGFLDLLRPHDQRSHVGRFFEKIGNEGFSGFSSVIERKSGENAATFSSTIYLVLIAVVLIAAVLLWLRPPRPLVAVLSRVPTLRPGVISLAVLLLLSYGLNDSGLSIPAIMLALVAATATYLLFEAGDSEARAPLPTLIPGSTMTPSGPSSRCPTESTGHRTPT